MFMDDGRTDAGVTGILLAHQRAFGSGELKIKHETIIIKCIIEHITKITSALLTHKMNIYKFRKLQNEFKDGHH